MKLEEAKKIQKESFDRRMKIRVLKAHDYATEDLLSNFKRMSRHMKNFEIDVSTPHGTALYMVVHKLDRLCNLAYRQKVAPKNESILDNMDDIKNYIDLTEELFIESGILKPE